MVKAQSVKAIQSDFSARIRDPQHHACPSNVDPERMKVYEELVFNNIEDILANNFPVIRTLLTDDYWENLVRHFLIEHRAKTPFFYQIPQEFLAFLSTLKKCPVFLGDLAHYEWMELDVELASTEKITPAYDPDGDLLQGTIVLAPIVRLVSYPFAVHRISADRIPLVADPELTFMAIYRDQEDVVQFITLNRIAARLLNLLMENASLTGQQAIQHVVDELQHPDPSVVQQGGFALLDGWREAQLIWGIKEGRA